MQIKDLIAKKRDGGAHDGRELNFILQGYLDGQVKDYQMAAWLMAVFHKGCTTEETAELTRIMWKSGVTFPRAHQNDYWIDKHSTGGVGDKTSLLIVPLVVAVARKQLGRGVLKIPMVSGRGLGHSGGTLDKLESVPGFSPAIPISKALALIEKNDFFMMGQTEDLAPMDRLVYALRDVTSTVECLPLIVSSIMSKKLSENPNGLVFDVKAGRGAFMKTEGDARKLAQALVDVAKLQGIDAVAVLTRMDEPLGWMSGNQLEIEECADFLTGKPREKGLEEVTLSLCAWMLHLASRKKISVKEAEQACLEALDTKEPFAIFLDMFSSQGGDWTAFEKKREQRARELKQFVYRAPSEGVVTRVEAMAVGRLINSLGGGRNRKEDTIDPVVGVECLKKCGEPVKRDEGIVAVHYRTENQLATIEAHLMGAIEISQSASNTQKFVIDTLEPSK